MDDRLCLLVIIGSDETGRKEAPKLAVGDGALGFWKAVAKCWPDTEKNGSG